MLTRTRLLCGFGLALTLSALAAGCSNPAPGAFVIKPQFNAAYSFSEGLAAVEIGETRPGKWGFIDKTGKVVIVHEATRTAGVGAEVAAIVAEGAFDRLDGPILRVTAPDTPVPFTMPLEEAFLPNADRIAAAAERLAAY